jgi:glycerol-3-phosphate acyltransferase PlsX
MSASPSPSNSERPAVIAVDAMGGDDAPEVVVRGALAAVSGDREIVLVGDSMRIESLLGNRVGGPGIRVVNATQVIGMDESPSAALDKKKDSSLLVAARLVKQGDAQALVSAGNTGALMAGSLLTMGRMTGIRRPAIAVTWPTYDAPVDYVLVLDCGANAESKPEYLAQFGHMGSVYMERVMGRPTPRVGLLNIGGEAGKGGTLVNHAYALLEKAGLNFVGNVEPTGMMRGEVDVVVTDGFVGNMILKTGESVAEMIMNTIKAGVARSLRAKIGAWLMKPVFRDLKRKVDHSEYGGALLLGLRGPVVKAHGRSNEVAIANAIKVASRAVSQGVIAHIGQSIQQAAAREGGADAASA